MAAHADRDDGLAGMHGEVQHAVAHLVRRPIGAVRVQEGAGPLRHQRHELLQRAAAAVALAPALDDAGRERLRVASAAVANPRLRVALVAAVEDDEEALLKAMANLEETARSVLHFGLPDLTSLSDSGEDRARLMRMVEAALSTYEPRFQNVIVSENATRSHEAREVRFLIQATLRMDPSPEVVYFDTVLDLSSREYEVKGD